MGRIRLACGNVIAPASQTAVVMIVTKVLYCNLRYQYGTRVDVDVGIYSHVRGIRAMDHEICKKTDGGN